MTQFERIFKAMPPVTKNLIIINILIWVVSAIFPQIDNNLTKFCALHYYTATDFNVVQLVTYMFMHGNFTHILFNMFTLFMFGITLEHTMGSKRFLIFYMVCGIGAGLIQEVVWALSLSNIIISELAANNGITTDVMSALIASNPDILQMNIDIVTTIGASGAIYGILLAFAMLYPNRPLYFMFIPVPVKAKYMMIFWGLLELLLGFSGASDGIAHFAHLGGMIFGFMLIVYWKKKDNTHDDIYGDVY